MKTPGIATDVQNQIDQAIEAIDFLNDRAAHAKREQLRAMRISCDAVMRFAQRHADLALEQAAAETYAESTRGANPRL